MKQIRLHFESPLAVYTFNMKKEMDLSGFMYLYIDGFEHIYIF